MRKIIRKFKNNKYIGSECVVHNNVLLSDVLNNTNAKVVYDNPEGERDLYMNEYGFGIYLIVTTDGSAIYSFRSNDDATKNSLGSYVKMDGSFGFIGPHGEYPYILASIDSNSNYPKVKTIIKLASFDT